jgi:hypothetical protein
VSVQKKTQELLPGLEFLFGKRRKKFAADDQFSFETAGLALAFLRAQGLEANEGLVATGDYDFLTLAGLFNEAREMRFGVMDFYRSHIS